MAMLGEQFMAGNEICGVVVSTRYQEYLLSIWNRTASDQATTARIRDALKRLLNIPASATMEYKTHNDCLKYVIQSFQLFSLIFCFFPELLKTYLPTTVFLQKVDLTITQLICNFTFTKTRR